MFRRLLVVVTPSRFVAPARAHFSCSLPYRQRPNLARRAIEGQACVLLLDTGANNSLMDYPAAGFDGLKLDALRSTGSAGTEGACIVQEVKLSPEHRPWLGRSVCVMDLGDVSRRMGTRIDGFVGQDLLTEFATLRTDYRAKTITLED